MAPMRIVKLNAAGWRTVLDYYDALKEALGSPLGHGSSPDAWVDSMIYGGMNEVEAPYVIKISGTANCSHDLKAEILLLADVIRKAQAWKPGHDGEDVDVSFESEP